jgi:predicted helicase
MTKENTSRVKEQQQAPIFVILGNPPYNVGQVNENDNNKNRKYPTMDQRVAETYSTDSAATNKNALSDPYVKAFRWASDRIGAEGIVAFVTNSSFTYKIAFDGMRKHLAQDFDALYILDLGGDIRENPKLSGTTHNVFGIQVGVSVNLLVKKKGSDHDVGKDDNGFENGTDSPTHYPFHSQIRCRDKYQRARIYYFKTGEYWRKEQKYQFLDDKSHIAFIEWQEIIPDKKENWLTEGMSKEFETFIPMGTKEAKSSKTEEIETIFKNYGRGVATSRDAWAYNFNREALSQNIQRMIETYNEHVAKWKRLSPKPNIDDFVLNDDTKISWSRDLKLDLKRGNFAEFTEEKVRQSLYRPFTQKTLFFDRILNEEIYQFPSILPIPETETENLVICVRAVGNTKEFHCLMTNILPDLHLTGESQCFPFYTYDEDGGNRRENITDWALQQFRERYEPIPGPSQEGKITKWDIFYYVYAILHHPQYREKYAANLKRDLPRIPFVVAGDKFPFWEGQGVGKKSSNQHENPEPTPNPSQEGNVKEDAEVFWAFAEAGKKLADLHVNYEQQPKYKLTFIEKEGEQLDWRVQKMKLSKDKTNIIYNHFLTLSGIPPQAFDYRLGNRSALEWVIDQYQIKTDKRSGIVNDPNRADQPDYIVSLIQRVITVSVETVKIINALPELEEL